MEDRIGCAGIGLETVLESAWSVLVPNCGHPVCETGFDVCADDRGASHSAVADMQCITQEAPSNAATRHNIDRYMSRSTAAARDRDFDDDFELIRSGPPRCIDIPYIPRWFTCPQTVTHSSSNHVIATRPAVKPTAFSL